MKRSLLLLEISQSSDGPTNALHADTLQPVPKGRAVMCGLAWSLLNALDPARELH